MKNNKIFVYGTLKRGMYNQKFIPQSMIANMWNATLDGDLYTVKGATFPAVINLNSGNTVYGELYEIKDEYIAHVIEQCDYLEGHPVLYKRTLVQVQDEYGNYHDAYTYIFCRKDNVGKLIKNGIFK